MNERLALSTTPASANRIVRIAVAPAGAEVLSSSAVGTIAGQVIMQSFTQYRIPLWLRRLVTMAPAFAVVALGIDATRALILSQVALSLVLPVPMIALLVLTRHRDIMGSCVSGFLTMAAATAAAAVVLALNVLLVLETLGVPLWQRLSDLIAQTNTHLETIIDPSPTRTRFYRLATPKQP